MLRKNYARGVLPACIVLVFGLTTAPAVSASPWNDSFREPSTLAPTVPTGDTEFGTRVLSRAMRPVFVRPQTDPQTGEVRTAPVAHDGWRPRLSALSKGASARFDGSAAPRNADPDDNSSDDAPALAGPMLGQQYVEQTGEPDEVEGDDALPLEELDDIAAGAPEDATQLAEKSPEAATDAPEEVDRQELAKTGPAAPLSAADQAGDPAESDDNDPGQQPEAIARAASNLKPLTRNQIALRDKVRRVLKYYYDHPLHTGNRGPWEVMHQMLAFEVHSQIRQHGPDGEPITAVGWLCFNQPCRKRNLLYINNDGELRVRTGPALQGHEGQLLALLAQARVKSTYPIRVDDKQFTIADLVEVEKKTCYPRTELTFKLLGLQNYLDIDDQWVNDQGMQWDFAKLVNEERRQPVRTAACGGTHRLSGLTFAYKKYEKTGRPLTGEFAQAKRFVANYQNYAYRLQNSDGSFSTEWFRGPGHDADIDRRLKTTGHILEWLLYAAEEKHFTYYRTVRGVNYLANLMWSNRGRDWEAGPLGHAIHALVLYDRLYFQPYDELEGKEVATGPGSSRR